MDKASINVFDVDRLRNQIADSRQCFNLLFENATNSYRKSDFTGAAGWAQIAAHFAWYSHPGFYVSSDLENLSIDIAGQIQINNQRFNGLVHERNSKRKVLHVMTEAYSVGGHTRVVERWINNSNKDSIHSVVVTRSGKTTPPWLIKAVEASSGTYIRLDKPNDDLIQRALKLRGIAQDWADTIVIHSHPMDPIPTLAFSVDNLPPVILFNHADHVFWIGSSVADCIADHRKSGRDLTLSRRGIGKSQILPIPLERCKNEYSYRTAREKIGIPSNKIVLLTVASAYKFQQCGNFDFIDILGDIVCNDNRLMLIAVGPQNDGKWNKFDQISNGRVKAIGPQENIGLYYAAADIYVNSHPLGSTTSMLEAGMEGKAIIGLQNSIAPMFSGDDISLDIHNIMFENQSDFQTALRSLVDDCERRNSLGDMLSDQITKDHTSHSWLEYLNNIYDILPSKHYIQKMNSSNDTIKETDLFLAWFDKLAHGTNAFRNSISANGRYLPTVERMGLLIKGITDERYGFFPGKTYLSNSIIETFHSIKQKNQKNK